MVAEEKEYVERGKLAERPLVVVQLEALARKYASGALKQEQFIELASYVIEEEIEIESLRDPSMWDLFVKYVNRALEKVVGALPKPKLGKDLRQVLADYFEKYRREVFGERNLSIWTNLDLEDAIKNLTSRIIFRAGLAALKEKGIVK